MLLHCIVALAQVAQNVNWLCVSLWRHNWSGGCWFVLVYTKCKTINTSKRKKKGISILLCKHQLSMGQILKSPPLSCLAPGLLDATNASFKSKRRPGGSLLPWKGKAWRPTLKCEGSHANVWRAIDCDATVVANPNWTPCGSPARHLDGENCKIELLLHTPTENVSLHNSFSLFY